MNPRIISGADELNTHDITVKTGIQENWHNNKESEINLVENTQEKLKTLS